MPKSELLSSQQSSSRQKPLVTAIRTLIAGGFTFGAGVSPSMANGAHPLPVNPVTVYGTATESLSNNGHTLTINNTNSTILNWDSFNIGKGYTVDFVGSGSAPQVLNNIGDQNASTIYGTLTANEHVYLVNQNGFIFENGSQVNVSSLLATTLGISQETLLAGISNVFNTAYTAGGASNAVTQGAALVANDNGTNYLQDGRGNYVLDSNGNKIPISIAAINVQPGATITTNAAGGLILLAAPTVNNAGAITATNGQVILAGAKDKVYLQDSSDPNVRGMLVEVGVGGQVTNTGGIMAQTGNVSMIGFAVNQNGIASATTSVTLNGSVRLLAEEGVQSPDNTGGVLEGLTTLRGADLGDGLGVNATVTLGAGGITSVTPDSSAGAAVAAQLQPKSYIEISGQDVNLLNGSLVQAQSGNVVVNALDTPVGTTTLQALNGTNTPQGNARIYMQSGSTIDVSGIQNVAEPISDNVVSIKLQSNELSNSPLQRAGVLYGQTVDVDVRDATLGYDASGNLTAATVPIANIIGSVQNIASNIQERNAAGGTINLNSSGDVIVNAGSTLNVSGGSIAYQSGYITTTELIAGGQFYNIGTASPNLVYSGLFNQTTYQSGYVQGAAGGQLNIGSYAALLDGNLQGRTVDGPQQRQESSWASGGSLSINLVNGDNFGLQNVVFSNSNSGLVLGAGDAFPLQGNGSSNPIALNLNASTLNNSGISNVTISTNGSLTIDQGVQINLPASGQLNLSAVDFNLQGGINIPSGTVDLLPNTVGGALSSSIAMGAASSINVSGLWINDWLNMQRNNALSPVAINGGSVKLAVLNSQLVMDNGSQITADSGAWKQTNGSVTDGKAGSINLSIGGGVELGRLSAWGLQQDGSLTIQADRIGIVSAAALAANNSPAQILQLSPAFFQQGFSSYNLVSTVYGLSVADNLSMNLIQSNLQLTGAATFAATGSQLTNIGHEVVLPEYSRKADNLTLSFTGAFNQNTPENLSIGSGTLIQTDPGGSVTLNSDTSILVDGVIDAPAGNIALNITIPGNDNGYVASQQIWLGSDSQLLAPGVFVPLFNANGLTQGNVLAGGSVSVNGNRGTIISQAGSLIDVSGAAAVLQAIELNLFGIAVNSTYTPSAGGSIRFQSGQGIFLDGGLQARSGGGAAAGGDLSVVLNSSLLNPPISSSSYTLFPDQIPGNHYPSVLEVTANNSSVLPVNLTEGGNIPAAYSNQALLKSSTINSAGFDSITLQTDANLTQGHLASAIAFAGNVQLDAGRQIILDSPTLQGVGSQSVELDAPYLALGSSLVNQQQPVLAPTAVSGPGSFNVQAQGVDLIGGLSFNGFDQVNLSSQGGVRMIGDANIYNKTYLGELNLAGNLDITASQIYPATLTDYSMNVTGTATFQNNGASAAYPLSAGGSLTVNALNIDQSGTLEAPFGAIILNAGQTLTLAGNSLTSVSGAGTIVPFGVGSGGATWLYPVDTVNNTNIVIYDQSTENLPQKSLQLNGQYLDLRQGANINLSGGGNLYAYEFIAGSGGGNDVLNVSATQAFAVLPGINNILTPYDPQQYAASGLTMGQSVYLNAAEGLAAGWYTMLPAHYALLPGAYLITPETATAGKTQTTYNEAGAASVAGYYGVSGTGIQNAVSQSFEVRPGSIFTGSIAINSAGSIVVNSNTASPSQFNAYLATAFFNQMAALNGGVLPQLPVDAGNLQIDATTSLSLAANLSAAPAGNGLGGQVDISADNLEVVGASQDLASLPAGTVGLLASQLNNFNAPSLLLGGKRSLNASGELITTTADNVTVAGDAVLKGQEILLAAMNQLTVAAGAQVLSVGNTGAAGGTLTVENSNGGSDGALVRVSSAGQVVVNRDLPISGNGGLLTVGSGAILQADSSMLLDSSSNTVFNGAINMNGGSLALDSSRISIGNAPANTPGLVLSSLPAKLDKLILNSTGDMDLYGQVTFGSNTVSISAASINGFNNAGLASTITATGQLDLSNSGAVSAHGGTGSGILNLFAQSIQLGSGQYAITGFQTVNIGNSSTQAIDGQGAAVDPVTGNSSAASPGVLTVAGNINLYAEHFSGGNGSTTTIDAGNHNVTFDSASNATNTLPTGLGAGWTVIGGGIDTNAARFDLPSGILSLTATTGDINLNPGTVIDLSGRSVAFANTYKYSPGGSLTLVANAGNVNLAGATANQVGANIDLAGAIQLNNGVNEQVSNAGSLTVQAVNGQFNWNGAVDAIGGAVSTASGVSSGNLQLDVRDFDNFSYDVNNQYQLTAFSALNTLAYNAGFSNDLILEQQLGNVTIAGPAQSGGVTIPGDTVITNQFQLTADQGAVTVDGTINVSGATAGSVSIFGENGITLAGTINAHSTGAGNAGGSVTLDTVDRTGSNPSAGLMNLSAGGGTINVSGGTGGNGGTVLFSTGRVDSSNLGPSAPDVVNVTAINTHIIGTASGAVLDATRSYSNINAGTDNANVITAANISAWQNDTAHFMNAAPSEVVNTLGVNLNLPASVVLMPGIEVYSPGNLTLAATWNFESGGSGWSNATSTWNSGWRYGSSELPGILTLRAAGDLNIDASLTDGVATTPILGQSSTKLYQDMIQPGLSWSYNLIAGGNVNLAASYQAPNPLAPNSNVATQVVVRTGTGDIQIQAGSNIVFNMDNTSPNLDSSNDASAVYTVGATAPYTTSSPQLQSLAAAQGESLLQYLNNLTPAQQNQLLRYGLLPQASVGSLSANSNLFAEYPTGGGNIGLNAGGNIQGQQMGQQSTDWQASNSNGSQPTAFGLNISSQPTNDSAIVRVGNSNDTIYALGTNNFNQNVGALGGGNVTVKAGANINELSVIIPTTVKPLGVLSSLNQVGTWVRNGTYVDGGGNLQVTAGNDIVAGEYYVGQGVGNLVAGGGIEQTGIPNSNATIGVILDVGNATFNLQARQDLNLEAALNPTVLQSLNNQQNALFFSYGSDSAVNLTSTAGNVVFLNNYNSIQTLKNLYTSGVGGLPGYEYTVYPGILSAAALSGDIRIDNSMELFPSVDGSLQLLANGNIGIDPAAVTNNTVAVLMGDVSPALLPSLDNPGSSMYGGGNPYFNYLTSSINYQGTETALIPLGTQNAGLIVANQGNISFPNVVQASISLPTAADIIAGGNIDNVNISAQNQSAGDVTLVQAGGSINYDTLLNDNGAVVSSNQGIQVAGPGQLQVLAGNSINLGSSQGMETVGNLYNLALSQTGATLEALAGVSGPIDYSAFIDKYQSNSAYSAELQGLAGLSADQQRLYLSSLLNVLFAEIRNSAAAAAAAPESQRYAIYQQGFQAIQTLFPGATYSGDINMVFSQIKTLAGGDIDLLTPGGGINVGLSGSQSGNTKSAADLGIVVQEQGSLNILTGNDLNVNQSRVFTMAGGDITAWSSAGSIDAGKGAKSAISAPPPVSVVNSQGQIVTTFPPIISGSGIQAIGGGSVYLAAPVGVVNAGEAGISGNNIIIAATAVVGASNISSTGTTVGVPTAVAAPVGLAGADSAAAGASNTASQTAMANGNAGNDDSTGKQKYTSSILTTDVIGFGKCSVSDVKAGTSGCGT